MKEIRKIVKWLHETFREEYVISRQEVMAWMVYPSGSDFKKVHVYSPTDILVKSNNGWLRHSYTRTLNHGYKMKKPIAFLWLKWLRRINSTKMVFQMMPLAKAIFITDLTGLVEN